MPLEHGNQRPPSAQWTATAAGAVVISDEKKEESDKLVPPQKTICLTEGTIGKIIDTGMKDANQMGAAMAPEDVNLDPYIFRCAERCVLHKIRYYHNHSLVFPLERTETENRQSHLIPYLTSSGILSAQMFFLSKHRTAGLKSMTARPRIPMRAEAAAAVRLRCIQAGFSSV